VEGVKELAKKKRKDFKKEELDDGLFIYVPPEWTDQLTIIKKQWKDAVELRGMQDATPTEKYHVAKHVLKDVDVVFDVSNLDIWYVVPKNPDGFCTVNIEGFYIGNTHRFVDMKEIEVELKKAMKTNEKARKSYIEMCKRILKEFEDEQ
jgi:hypothetical protein